MMKKIKLLLIGIASISLISSCVLEPEADFSYSEPTEVGQRIQFTNLSTNSDSYAWEFGDGATSSVRSPSHTYEKPGTYTVTLTAEGEGGTNSISKSLRITGTTYSFTNMTSVALYDFHSYHWTGEDVVDLTEHGTLTIGEETDVVITERRTIDFAFRLSPTGDIFISFYSYNLTINRHNYLSITDETQIYGKKSAVDTSTENKLNALKTYIEGLVE